MSQHSPECDESSGSWLPLVEYSIKSGLSLSTIRRKIKSNSLPFRLENGRYLIFCEESVATESVPAPVVTRREEVRFAPTPPPAVRDVLRSASSSPGDAVRMMGEAFEHALREKDERILLLERANRELEDRLNELRLLVKVLEEKYEVRY